LALIGTVNRQITYRINIKQKQIAILILGLEAESSHHFCRMPIWVNCRECTIAERFHSTGSLLLA
jgi:hypothetical protein